ncbi:MAG: endonuclease V [Alphaproteobacteria bacterium]
MAIVNKPFWWPGFAGFYGFADTPGATIDSAQMLNRLNLHLYPAPSQYSTHLKNTQGIAHPRRLGISAHVGVLTGLPTIGVAKSVLCGSYKEPGPAKGKMEPLVHKSEKIGTALRSRDNVKPIFISPGHRVDHESAVALVLRCLTKYRLPEPTRLADKFSKIVHTGQAGLLSG